MLADGHTGGHFGWANRAFVARNVAPLLSLPDAPLPPSRTAAAPKQGGTANVY